MQALGLQPDGFPLSHSGNDENDYSPAVQPGYFIPSTARAWADGTGHGGIGKPPLAAPMMEQSFSAPGGVTMW